MAQHVCMGATLKCSMAFPPPGTSTLVVLPKNKVMTSYVPAANIMDNVPTTNIVPFTACMSMLNPATAAATAAALGTLTPMACVPTTPLPWAPGAPTVMLANMPALDNTSKLVCMLGGVIEILMPGQTTENIP